MDCISSFFSPGMSSVCIFFRVLFLLVAVAVIPAVVGCILVRMVFPFKGKE